MRTLYSLSQFVAECARCAVMVDEAGVYDAIGARRVVAWRPSTKPSSASLLEEWDGQGGWPADAVLPWCAVLAFVPVAGTLQVAALCRIAVDPTTGARFRWHAVERWLDLHGTLGQLGDIVPLLSDNVIASMSGAPRLEARLIRLIASVRGPVAASGVSVTDDVATYARPAHEDAPVITLPLSHRATSTPAAPVATTPRARLRELRQSGQLDAEAEALARLLADRAASSDAEKLEWTRRLGAILAWDMNRRAEALEVLMADVRPGLHDDAFVAETASLLRELRGPAAALELYEQTVAARSDSDGAVKWSLAAADLCLVEPELASRGLAAGLSTVQRFGRTTSISEAISRLAHAVGDADLELEHGEYALATGTSDVSGRLAARIGLLLWEQGDAGRAEHYVREALAQRGLSTDAVAVLVTYAPMVGDAVGDTEIAWLLWRHWEQKFPNEVTWAQRLALAQAAADQGHAGDAIEAAERALSQATLEEASPAELSRIHLVLGRLKRGQNRMESAAWHIRSSAPPELPPPTENTPVMGIPQPVRNLPISNDDDLTRLLASGDVDRIEAAATRLRGQGLYEDAATLLEQLADMPDVVADQPRRARVFSALASVYERMQSPAPHRQR